MAYKNRKKNKKHIADLKSDVSGWRRRQRRKKAEIKHRKEYKELDIETCERLLKQQGMI